MGLSFGVVVQALLLATGIVWCLEMFSRLREHLQDVRTSDWSKRIALIILWVLTLFILYYCLRFIYVIGARIWQGLQHFR